MPMALEEHARNIRRNIIEAGHKAGTMHFGGSLSMADLLAYLYGEEMRCDAQNPLWEGRDRFILSKGHCGLALYAALCEFGFMSREELMSVDDNGGLFPSHCVRNLEHGIEVSSGSLGLGLSFGIGQALALRDAGRRVYVLAGNGEANEGAFWEAAMFAGHKRVENIALVLDDNGMQLDGDSSEVMPVGNWAEKFRAFGWTAVEADGHDFDSIRNAFQTPREGKPLAVVAHTVKGKGVSFMENSPQWHHARMTEEQFQTALAEIGGEP